VNIAKNIVISQRILLAHKVRTALSLSGVIIGICAVLIMVSIGRGTEQKVISQIMKMGSNLVVVTAGRVKIIAGRARQTKLVTTLEPKDADDVVEKSSSINYAVPAQNRKLPVKYGNLSTRTSVIGTTTDIMSVRNFTLSRGRFFDEDEDKGRRRVAVLGQTVVENLFAEEEPLGETIRVGRVPFTIIGVLAPKGLDINGTDQDDQIIIPLRTALRRLFNVTYISTIYVQARDRHVMHAAEVEVRGILRRAHHLRGDKSDDFTIQNQASVIDAQRESGRMFTLLIGSIAAVSVLVGGIGIVAVMLISIRERIKEIGIRMAVGARKSDILIQFLAESLLLSIGGGIVGTLVGGIGAVVISICAGWPFILPWNMVAMAFLSTVVIGILCGVYPARKAANLDPVTALQFE